MSTLEYGTIRQPHFLRHLNVGILLRFCTVQIGNPVIQHGDLGFDSQELRLQNILVFLVGERLEGIPALTLLLPLLIRHRGPCLWACIVVRIQSQLTKK